MHKFLIKIGLIILAGSGLFVWFRMDASVIAGASVLGIDDSTSWTAANSHNPEVIETLEAANTGMLRVELPWDAIELSPGVFSWRIETEHGRIDFDALFNRLQRHGIEPVVVLTGGPAYLSHLYPQQPVFRGQLLENWERYVRAAMEQFGDQVNYWQIGGTINDPDEWGRVLFPAADEPQAVPDPVLYSEMLKVAYSAIKGAQAGDTVLLGELAFSSDCTLHPNNYLQVLSDQDAWYAFDTASISLPVLSDAPEKAVVDTCGIMPLQLSGIPSADSIHAVADTVDKIGHKPLWVNNLRFTDTFLHEEAAQRGTLYEVTASDFLARASGLLLAYGDVDRIFWAFDPLENTPGLIALQTYANLSHTLSGRFDGSGLPASKDAFALRFRSNGKLSLLAWYANGGEEAVPMMISGVESYSLKAFSADSDSLKSKHGIKMPVDDGGNIALLVSERPVLISGRPSDIKGTVTQTVEDSAAQASAGMQAKLNNWIQAQKAKAAAKVGDWVEKQQASLLDSLRTSLEEWLRKSLGLA